MTLSNTSNFNPSFGECVLQAFNLCGIRPTEITQEHMQSARMAANLMQGRWSADGLNLWKVELVSTPLVEGTSTYSYDGSVIVMLDAYISIANGDGTFTDRIILPISRSEYATYPNKTQQGFPTVYWADRLLSPNVTLWPVPDGNEAYLRYYAVQQIEDATLANGLQLDLPIYFMEAFCFGLAWRLAQIWTPEKVGQIKPLADESYQVACEQNVETANIFISPQISGYWRV